MKNTLLLGMLMCMFLGINSSQLLAQYKINQFTPDTISFDSFAASGLQPIPQAGELNSTHWRIKGLSDGNSIFGGSYSSGDFARGTSTGGVSTGGLYAFDNGTTGTMLGVQPIASDFTPGSFTLKVQNNTSQVIKDLEVKYTVWFLNNEDRANSFNFFHSFNDTTYTQDTTVKTTSLELADTLGWQSYNKVVTLKDINIAVGDLIYLQWTGDDATGSGSRDEFGLDNIILNAEEENVIPIADIQIAHNSAATDLDTVDIYLDDSLLLDNFPFRTASKFISIKADETIRLGISPSNSTDTNNAYYTQSIKLVNGSRYVAMIYGLWGNGYNPSASVHPLNIHLKDKVRDMANNVGNTDILFHHGSSDVGIIDISETSVPAGIIVNNAVYGKYRGYYEFLTDDYALKIMDSSSAVQYYTYDFKLDSYNLMDSAILVVTSGFANTLSNNNGASFDLMLVPQVGGNFISLTSLSTGMDKNKLESNVQLYPNPTSNYLILQSTGIKNLHYTMFNTLGEKVMEGLFNDYKKILDVSNLAKGSYILRFSNDDTQFSRIFIK